MKFPHANDEMRYETEISTYYGQNNDSFFTVHGSECAEGFALKCFHLVRIPYARLLTQWVDLGCMQITVYTKAHS